MTKKKNKGGRPSSYKPEYNEQAFKLCLLGAKDEEIAKFFGVAESTLNNWKIDHPEFLESLKEGKVLADSNVGQRLYERAMGYSHEEEVIKVIAGEVVKVQTTKHYPPDTTAAIFWLKNRRKEDWRDQKVVEDGPERTKNNKDASEHIARIIELIKSDGSRDSSEATGSGETEQGSDEFPILRQVH